LTNAGCSGPVTVVVGRFDPVFVRGLVWVLGDDPGVCVVGSGLPHSRLEPAVVRLAPQVTIVDEAGERAVSERLRLLEPATALVVLAQDPARVYGMALLAAGVSCFARDVSEVALASAVRRVARGARIFAGSTGELVQFPGDVELLTEREREVAVRLSDGESYSQIAFALGIGVRTVETYAGGVRHKLHARHNRELVGMPLPGAWRSSS
jgi:DNA-binding NarL/FixJ family response regulator